MKANNIRIVSWLEETVLWFQVSSQSGNYNVDTTLFR